MSEFQQNEKGWALTCYIPVFNLVTCAITSVKMVNSKFCLFHARQGLVLFVLWFITVVAALFSQWLSLLLWVVVLFLHGAGIAIVLGMKQTLLPIIGQYAMKIPETYIFTLLTGKKPN